MDNDAQTKRDTLSPSRSAVITGASQGIGRAIAIELANRGTECILVGRDASALTEVSGEILAAGGRAHCMTMDLADTPSIKQFSEQVRLQFSQLNVLVNCAGAFVMNSWVSSSEVDYTMLFETNVRGTFELTRALLPLLSSGRGDIVFVNSTIIFGDGRGVGLYAASKHALKGLADSLRAEVNDKGIRVLSVYPGRTDTLMQIEAHAAERRPYDATKLLQPMDVARAIAACIELSDSAEVTELTIRPRHKREPA